VRPQVRPREEPRSRVIVSRATLQAGQQQQPDEVGQRHQAVHDVGEGPDELELLHRADEDDEHEREPVGQHRGAAEEPVHVALAVVGPAEQRREGEERDAQRHDDAAPLARQPLLERERVSTAPVSPEVHAPVTMIASPVKDTTTSVSMKVWVIDTSAWRTGLEVCAAAAAMPPVPSPDSLEKMPRATPKRIAAATPAPAKPPVGGGAGERVAQHHGERAGQRVDVRGDHPGRAEDVERRP
jgi:hypothetical protein